MRVIQVYLPVKVRKGPLARIFHQQLIGDFRFPLFAYVLTSPESNNNFYGRDDVKQQLYGYTASIVLRVRQPSQAPPSRHLGFLAERCSAARRCFFSRADLIVFFYYYNCIPLAAYAVTVVVQLLLSFMNSSLQRTCCRLPANWSCHFADKKDFIVIFIGLAKK